MDMQRALRDILAALEEHRLLKEKPNGCDDLAIAQITHDSREVLPGTLFACKGLAFKDEYLFEAVRRGAVCYLSETYIEAADVPAVLVTDIRRAMAAVAITFTGGAYKRLKLTGLTGTKGKTTTTYFLRNILDEACGQPTGVLSTVEVYTGGGSTQAHLTTPEPFDLHRHFADAVDHGLEYLTMEVSSQAYLLDRVWDMTFPLGIFLNISEDHIGPLEHPDFENYLACKLEFIRNCETILVNGGTDEKERVLAAAASCKKLVTFGMTPDCDLFADNIRRSGDGFLFDVHDAGKTSTFAISMLGRFNVENALAAVAAARHWGIGDEVITKGLARTSVLGRMNVFCKDGVTVIVDYAHNRLSFTRLYESLKLDYPGRRLVVVFGCPGGHAQLRRRDLGILAGRHADYVYLTAEDPQFEDVASICGEIASYITPFGVPCTIIEDRSTCIRRAIEAAKPGDVVVLAAKGEEYYQKVRGEYRYYESDLAIARELLGAPENELEEVNPRASHR